MRFVTFGAGSNVALFPFPLFHGHDGDVVVAGKTVGFSGDAAEATGISRRYGRQQGEVVGLRKAATATRNATERHGRKANEDLGEIHKFHLTLYKNTFI